MLNNEKIILMTKMSIYERDNKDKEIKSGKYFKSDYMTLKMLGSFASVTVAYILGVLLWFMYNGDGVISMLTTTGRFVGLVLLLVIIYLILTVCYMLFSHAFFSRYFRTARGHLKEYNGDLKTLHRIQETEYDSIINDLSEDEGDAL